MQHEPTGTSEHQENILKLNFTACQHGNLELACGCQ